MTRTLLTVLCAVAAPLLPISSPQSVHRVACNHRSGITSQISERSLMMASLSVCLLPQCRSRPPAHRGPCTVRPSVIESSSWRRWKPPGYRPSRKRPTCGQSSGRWQPGQPRGPSPRVQPAPSPPQTPQPAACVCRTQEAGSRV